MRYAAFSRGRFRRALCLGLSIANGLGQHLVQFSLRLRRLSLGGFLPGHEYLYGVPE
jgi:hypothetical protein